MRLSVNLDVYMWYFDFEVSEKLNNFVVLKEQNHKFP